MDLGFSNHPSEKAAAAAWNKLVGDIRSGVRKAAGDE
jgi:hypothetical protein